MENAFSSQKINPLSTNPTKWSNTLKQFVGNLPTNCLSVFDHFVTLARKGLRIKLLHLRYDKISELISNKLQQDQVYRAVRTRFNVWSSS